MTDVDVGVAIAAATSSVAIVCGAGLCAGLMLPKFVLTVIMGSTQKQPEATSWCGGNRNRNIPRVM